MRAEARFAVRFECSRGVMSGEAIVKQSPSMKKHWAGSGVGSADAIGVRVEAVNPVSLNVVVVGVADLREIRAGCA